MDYHLSGKRVLITGASKGIGMAIAKAFLAEGARVAINSSNRDNLDRSMKELDGRPEMAIQATIGDAESTRHLYEKIAETWGELDILVNNAGVMLRSPIMDTTEEDFDRVFKVNVRGTFLSCKNAFPLMREHGGVIVNTSSYAAITPSYGAGVYASSKAAIRTLTAALAGEVAPYGIRINSYMPGFITTDMNIGLRENATDISQLYRNTALRRFGTPEEMANVVLFLASDCSSYLCGESINASGGKYAIQNPWKAWDNK